MSKFSTNILFDTNHFELLLSQQKMVTFLENKVLLKLNFSKNVNNEKCALKMIFFNEMGFFRKVRISLDIENWLRKSEFANCLGPEVVQSRLYQKNIGAESTHLYMYIFIVLGDYCDCPKPWTIYSLQLNFHTLRGY